MKRVGGLCTPGEYQLRRGVEEYGSEEDDQLRKSGDYCPKSIGDLAMLIE
jgi:hypothetical protein